MPEPKFFPFPASSSESEQVARLAWLREHRPLTRVVVPSGHEVWLATRYREARRILGDPRFGVVTDKDPAMPRLTARPSSLDLPVLRHIDPPDHRRLRTAVTPAFTARRIEQLRPLVQRVAERLLDGLEGGRADLVSDFTDPLPAAVVCAWLNLPDAEADRILSWNNTATSAVSAGEIQDTQQRMRRYAAELVGARRAAPGDDVLGALVAACDERGELSEEELLGLVFTLVFAGQSTISDLLASALDDLLRERRRWERLRADPSLVSAAVEEMLRVHTVLKDGHLRVAGEDVDLDGTTVRAGEFVVVSVHSANRDADVFPDPDHLDLERARNPHLTFGHGIHHCLATHLNRVELQVGLESVLQRLPTLRPAGPDQDRVWKPQPRLRGVASLPVTW